MLKTYQKKKKEIFSSPNAFFGKTWKIKKEKNVKKWTFGINYKHV